MTSDLREELEAIVWRSGTRISAVPEILAAADAYALDEAEHAINRITGRTDA